MRVKLGLKDFMQIKRAGLVFEPGITVIVGPNSSGKSTIMRAMDVSIRNHRHGKKFIRWGQKKTVVALQIDDSEPIKWLKSKRETMYKFGEEPHMKAGNTRLHELLHDFPFIQDPVDPTGRILNFLFEDEKPFPFDRSAVECFKTFEKMFQIAESAKILKTMDADQREINGKLIANKENQEKNEQKIEMINEFLELIDVKKLQEYQERLFEFTQGIQEMQTDLEDAERLTTMIDVCEKIKIRDFDFSPVTSFFELDDGYRIAGEFAEFVALAEKIKLKDFDFAFISGVHDAVEDFSKGSRASDFIEVAEKITVKDFDFAVVDSLFNQVLEYQNVVELHREAKKIRDVDLIAVQREREEKLKELSSVDACPACERPFEEGEIENIL